MEVLLDPSSKFPRNRKTLLSKKADSYPVPAAWGDKAETGVGPTPTWVYVAKEFVHPSDARPQGN